MSMIDWKNAPEWATGYGLMSGSFGIEEVWFNDKQYLPLQSQGGYGPYPFGGGIGPHMHNATKSKIAFQKHRPAPWSGEGLPPVGTVCEVLNNTLDRPEWERCTILFMGKFKAIYESESCHERVADVSESWMISFRPLRPLRTPEQIAAEEREKAVSQMAVVALAGDNHLITKVYLVRLYDAGYRLVTP